MKRHVKASSAGSNSGLAAAASARPKLLATLCFAFALIAAFTASPALAVETHPYAGISFGPDGTKATSFNRIGGVAVDPANDNVYVYDWAASKIYKFDSVGNPVNFSGLGKNVIENVNGNGYGENQIAIAPPGSPGGTVGDIYFAGYPRVVVYDSDGTKLGVLTEEAACGVATDPLGHVFVGYYPETVREYTPTASPVKESDETAASKVSLLEICNVAADGLGNVYAATFFGEQGVVKLEGLKATAATPLDPPIGHTMGVDPATNDIYVNAETSVAQFDSSALQVDVFGTGRLIEAEGIAVGAGGNVYVGNGKPRRVEVFGPLGVVPDVTPEAATAIGPHTATLNGTVNPDGLAVTGCQFEYATAAEFNSTGEYGKTAPCEGAIPTDSSDHPVTASLSGLSVETTYHFRLAATNANGTNESKDQTFATASAAFTRDATAIAGTKATLNGSVFPEGEAVSECTFEYGLTTSYGKTAPCVGAIPTDEDEHPVTAALTHLAPNGTTYHFRLVINRGGIIKGVDKSFKTTDTVVTEGASASSPLTATIEGTVNPEGILYTECKFEYGPTTSYGSSVACAESPATIGEGTSPVSVHADLSGLVEPTYHYRLVATNVDGTAKGKDRSFGAPLIEDQQAHGVTDTEAELAAAVNPKSLATTYHLEYGTSVSYGQSTAEVEVGADETKHELADILEGLAPDTVYHWRAVATNAHGVSKGIDRTFTTHPTFSPETNCPNQALRTGASAALPDCRAYEMVSPSQKAGEVIPPEPGANISESCSECLPGQNSQTMPMQAAPDGESVLYMGQPFSSGLAAGPNEYVSDRHSSGWATQSLSSPITTGQYQAFSSDLFQAVLFQDEPALSPEAPTKEGHSYRNLYLRDEDGSLQPLVTEEPPHHNPGAFILAYTDTNAGTATVPEFSHLAFEANDALTAAIPGVAPEAPEITGGGQACNLSAECNLYEWQEGQLRLVNVLPGNTEVAAKAVLGSGRLLASGNKQYEAPNVDHAISDDGSRIFWSTEESGHVYARIDGNESLEIPGPDSCKESLPLKDRACFLTASADGSKALLSHGQVYELDEEAGAYEPTADLTAGQGGFKGILGAAEDLSDVYFVDTAVLTGAEENANGEQAEAGKPNLYAWNEGITTFIGTLREDDDALGQQSRYGTWKASRPDRLAQVTTDGDYLAFMSIAPLTGYDSSFSGGGECIVGLGSACPEVFIYAAGPETLSCASCNPTGQRPIGPSNLSLIRPAGPPFPQPGNLSTNGSGRVFFESQDTLSPHDLNGDVQDVYQWEPNGVGSCTRAAGCIALISSGQSPNDSMFLDSTPSGNDVFFITREKLLLRDKDDQLDLYDARVGGGIAEDITPPCLGEACRGRFTSPAEQQGPGSSTFSGPGNEKPKKHKKKKKRRKHKSHHKRSAKHNRGGQK